MGALPTLRNEFVATPCMNESCGAEYPIEISPMEYGRVPWIFSTWAPAQRAIKAAVVHVRSWFPNLKSILGGTGACGSMEGSHD